MPPQSLSRPAALVTAMALGAVSAIAAGPAAGASLPGGDAGLTASNNSNQIKWTSHTLTTTDSIEHAAWSPDGSRAVYIDADGFVKTVRFDNGSSVEWVTPIASPPLPDRASPTWLGAGSAVLYAEKPSPGEPWQLVGSGTSWSSGEVVSGDDGYHYENPDGGPGWSWVYQRRADDSGSPTGTPQIWIHHNGSDTQITTDATNPALSPDGSKVAFVRDGQIWQCAVSGCTDLTQVTSDDGAKDDPTWSPDGLTIAFRNDSVVATALADGSQAATPTPTSLVGVPAYQTTKKNMVARLSGSNRFGTAIATSQSFWATAGDADDPRKDADAVVLSRSDLFADALGGSALAAAKNGPLLMTPPTSLNAATKAEIQRVLGSDASATVYLLGGLGALSQAVQDEVAAMGYVVKRLADTDRYTTAIKIANEIDPNPNLILVATGKNFPDALAAGAAAGSFNVPGAGTGDTAVVILSADSSLTAPVKSYLTSKDVTSTYFFGIGGQGYNAAAGALGPDHVWDVAGNNRYSTALFTAWTFFGTENHVGLATGSNWPDALAGGALMAALNGPLLLTPSGTNALHADDVLHLDTMSGTIDTVLMFGGIGAINAAVEDAAGAVMSGPDGYIKAYNPVSGITAVAGVSATAGGSLTAPNPTHKSIEEIKAAVERLHRR